MQKICQISAVRTGVCEYMNATLVYGVFFLINYWKGANAHLRLLNKLSIKHCYLTYTSKTQVQAKEGRNREEKPVRRLHLRKLI